MHRKCKNLTYSTIVLIIYFSRNRVLYKSQMDLNIGVPAFIVGAGDLQRG
jgi:hypothetical protein